MTLGYLPSPPSPYLSIGPLMLHWYAIMVILGVIAAAIIGQRRWSAHGGAAGTVLDVAIVAVPFGILGGRLYHVITSWQLFFGPGRHPIEALYVWQGGLGVWGAIAGGALGAWLVARRRRIDFAAFADALAPGLLVGQAIGRIGCWSNQELYGRPTTLPWGCRSTLPTGPLPRRTSPSTIRPSPTKPCGTLARPGSSYGRSGAGNWTAAEFSPSTWPHTPPAAAGSRCCGSTPPTTSWGCA